MTRFALALVLPLALVNSVRAVDPPTGTWAANADGTKGDFIIKEIKDGKVTGSMLGTDFTGTWNGKALAFTIGTSTYEAHLVTEPGEKDQTKYTLTGTRLQGERIPSRVVIHTVKTGWYAQMTAAAPVPQGEIAAEIRGVLVLDGTSAYVSVKRKTGSEIEETRVWVHASEGEWKKLDKVLAPLNGKEVTVTAKLAQMTSKGASLPEGALYFLGRFEPKLAGAK